ncbi:gas vesicle protein GvpG [Kovacikia minuta CCNUW1]|uniref:gas vesicle protein GvpG n=1 Tax=Kovacikia minuta TaxID=2931930 RepID=UPI001CC987E8|nr:gas vesicle protein GvpG [Kovacikia minuta]UBF27375.1 gas vesicle protein GvpG [Kovacikia minuta CCNUW1]
MLIDFLLSPLTGLTWIAEQIQERAEAELDNQENLHKRLLALQIAVDMGEISEEEFEEQEEALLLAIQAIEDRQRQEAAIAAEIEAEYE